MSVAASKRDYYEILGVERDVAPEQLKKAYRRLAHKYHPDRNQGDPDAELRFKESAEAYEVLSDPRKRERYDQFGHAGVAGSGVHDYAHMNVGDIFSMFGDIFGMDLGGGRRGSRGANLETQIELTLAEVLSGTERTITFRRRDLCAACEGTGAAPGTRRKTCGTCGGYGQVEQSGGLASFFGRVITSCPSCGGAGSTVTTPCGKCRGSGRAAGDRTVTVKVPPGVQDGQAVRVRGEGEPSEDGRGRGDLHCFVRIAPHPFLERHNNDLVCRMPITFTQAALGAKVEVPTITGRAEVTIPAGTQNGQLFRLAEMGLPDMRTRRRGDEIVQVMIEIPKRLNKKQESLLREFAATEDKSVLPESKGFFERLMEYFGGAD
jgi:molecular chaperone DnaJ